MSPFPLGFLGLRGTRPTPALTAVASLALALLMPPAVAGQPCPGCPGPGHHHGQGPQGPPSARGGAAQSGAADGHAQDMELFHYLMDHGSEIRRTITQLPTGVDTLTESDNPEVAARIQMHVLSMSARVKEARPIHRRDPLFAAIFANTTKIAMQHENTPKGVRVIETSDDPYVAKLIKAHAEVVSLFIKNGRQEAMKNHDVPTP